MTPVFILASPRSFTSMICAMLGQHPSHYGMPELNLFLADTLGELIEHTRGEKHFMLHGLLRAVAQLYAGEQTLVSLDLVRRWIGKRLRTTTADIYRELEDKVGELAIIDKSPVYVSRPEILERLWKAYPAAHFLHLVRHPLTQGQSMMKAGDGAMAKMARSYDTSTRPPVLDPQIAWLRNQRLILDFLRRVPAERQMTVRGEDVLSDPQQYLPAICAWLGRGCDAVALEAMLHPEDSPFACLGPLGANLGNDVEFLKSPAFRARPVAPGSLQGPLPWRPDGKPFTPEVVDLARHFGYE